MHLFKRPASPYGYLLPLRGAVPPLELRLSWVRVYFDQRHALRCDAADEPLPAKADPCTALFSVRRDAQQGHVFLCSDSELVSLNGKYVPSTCSELMTHGAQVSFGQTNAEYVYVDTKKSESILPPQMNKKYLVGNRLGSGVFGAVHALFELDGNYQRKALKIIHSSNKDARQECDALMKLNHPCVVKVHGDLVWNQQRFLVLENMAGGDLTQFVNNERPLSEAQTKLIFFQLALAMKYLHDRNICHLNLKPENILLERCNPRTLIKVTDFGLIKGRNDDAVLRTCASSRPYLAPEIINKQNYCTKPADVWSMGIILCFSLTGALPFKDLDQAVRCGHVVDYVKPQWEGVSPRALWLVRAMLEVKPSSRPTAEMVAGSIWLQDEIMRQDASELTGLKDVQRKAEATSAGRVVYIGSYNHGQGEMDYVYLEAGSKRRLGQRYDRCLRILRLRGRMVFYTILFFILLILVLTIIRDNWWNYYFN